MWVTGEYFDAFRDAEVAARGRLDRSVQSDPFARLEWFAQVWEHAPPGIRPLIVRARTGTAEAWLFLARTRRDRLVALASGESLRFAPVFVGDPDDELRRALLRAIARRLRILGVKRVTLAPMLHEDAALVRRAFHTGWAIAERSGPSNFLLDLHGRSFDEYWDSRSDKLHERVAAGLRDLHVEIAERITSCLWEEVELVAGVAPLMHAVAEAEHQGHTLRLGIARVGDTPVAAQLWSVEGGRALARWRTEDSAARHLEPSAQLTASMLRYVVNIDHVQSIDLGNGREDDLADWADERRVLRRLDLFNRATPSAWGPAIAASAAALVRRPPLD